MEKVKNTFKVNGFFVRVRTGLVPRHLLHLSSVLSSHPKYLKKEMWAEFQKFWLSVHWWSLLHFLTLLLAQ